MTVSCWIKSVVIGKHTSASRGVTLVRYFLPAFMVTYCVVWKRTRILCFCAHCSRDCHGVFNQDIMWVFPPPPSLSLFPASSLVSPSAVPPIDAIPIETSSEAPLSETSDSGGLSSLPDINGLPEPSGEPSGFEESGFPSGEVNWNGLTSGENGLPSGSMINATDVSMLPSGDEELSEAGSRTEDHSVTPGLPEISGLPSGISGEGSGLDLSSALPSGEYDYGGLTSGFPTVSLVNTTLVEVVTTATERELEGKGTIGVSGDRDFSGFPSAEWDASGLPSGHDSHGKLSRVPDISGLPSGLDFSGQSSGVPATSGLSSGIDFSGAPIGMPDRSGFVDVSGQASATDGSGEPSGVIFTDTNWFEVSTPSTKEEEGKGFVEISGLPSGDEDISGTVSGILGQPSGQIDFNGWTSGTHEVSGLTSGHTDISGESSGVGLTSGLASGMFDYSGLPSGFPTISLVDTTLVEVVTQPSVAQELGEGTSGVLEISGFPSRERETSGETDGVTILSGLPSGTVDISETSSSIPYSSGEIAGVTDRNGEASSVTDISGEVSGIPEVTLLTSDLVEAANKPVTSQELAGKTEARQPHLTESSGETSTISGESSAYTENIIKPPEYHISGETATFHEVSVESSTVHESIGKVSVLPESFLERSTLSEMDSEKPALPEGHPETSGIPFVSGLPSEAFEVKRQIHGDSSGPLLQPVSDVPDETLLPKVLLHIHDPEQTEFSKSPEMGQVATENYTHLAFKTEGAAIPEIPQASPTAPDALPNVSPEETDMTQHTAEGIFEIYI